MRVLLGKRLYILHLLCCCLAGALCAPQLHAQENKAMIQAGKVHLLDGECQQAVLLFSEHLKEYGFDREAFYWRAHCLIQMQMEDEAIQDLKLILQYHPKDHRAMDALGYAYNQTGKYLDAIQWFNKAITYDDRNALIYNNRGMSYYYLGKFPTAFYDFNKAIHLDSTFAEAYSNRGSTRYNNQNIAAATTIDLRKAEEDFSKALELDPVLLSAYRNRGIIRLYLKDYPGAFLDLQKAIYLDPDDPLVYQHMGDLLKEQKEYKEALYYYGESLKLNPHEAAVYFLRAEVYEAMGKPGSAREEYELIMRVDDRERGRCYYRMARTFALEANRDEIYYWLNQARKAGYFKVEAQRQKALTDPLLTNYWTLPEFAKLREKVL